MYLEYDKSVDAAYIYLEDSIEKGGVDKTISLNDQIILDFDKNGKLLGIEILHDSKVLKQKALVEAKRI